MSDFLNEEQETQEGYDQEYYNQQGNDEDIDITNEEDKVQYGSGESAGSPELYLKFYDPEIVLDYIKKTLEGKTLIRGEFVKTDIALARTEIINMVINRIRSIMNSVFIMSDKSPDEMKYNIMEANKGLVDFMLNDCTIRPQNAQYIIDLMDHTLDMFRGIVQGGRGANKAIQLLHGIYDPKSNQGEDMEKRKNALLGSFTPLGGGGNQK